MNHLPQIRRIPEEVNKKVECSYSFIFSSNILDWQRKRTKQAKEDKVLQRKLNPYKPKEVCPK